MNRPSAVVNFERISLASVLVGLLLMIWMVSKQSALDGKVIVLIAGWVIFNVFLILTITCGKSLVSRAVYGVVLGFTAFFSFDTQISMGFMPQVKFLTQMGPYLYFNGLLCFALLYLLFDASTTEWLKSPVSDDDESEQAVSA